MDSNERLLEQVRRLLNAGVNQKVLAAKLHIPASTFSKWINGQTTWQPPITAQDWLAAYRDEMMKALDMETQRSEAATETTPTTATGTAGRTFRQADR